MKRLELTWIVMLQTESAKKNSNVQSFNLHQNLRQMQGELTHWTHAFNSQEEDREYSVAMNCFQSKRQTISTIGKYWVSEMHRQSYSAETMTTAKSWHFVDSTIILLTCIEKGVDLTSSFRQHGNCWLLCCYEIVTVYQDNYQEKHVFKQSHVMDM